MKISVVIPTLNESARLSKALRPLLESRRDVEIIISDGGSTDETCTIAKMSNSILVRGSCGRGQQLVRGVQAATGDVLLFLHADTQLPPNAMEQISTAFDNPHVIGGNFELIFDGGSAFATWLNGYYAWLRSKGFYYGDSAIFVRRDVYDDIDGLRPLSLMEDYDLVRRLERAGHTVCLNAPSAVTSSRRFQGRKPWLIYWQWLYLHALYHMRVPSSVLAWLYRSKKHTPAGKASKTDQIRNETLSYEADY